MLSGICILEIGCRTPRSLMAAGFLNICEDPTQRTLSPIEGPRILIRPDGYIATLARNDSATMPGNRQKWSRARLIWKIIDSLSTR